MDLTTRGLRPGVRGRDQLVRFGPAYATPPFQPFTGTELSALHDVLDRIQDLVPHSPGA